MESLARGHHVNFRGSRPLLYMAHMPMTKRTLKTADPTIVLKPTAPSDKKVPMKEVANSGAEPPPAISVAPATSSSILNSSQITYVEFWKRKKRKY